MISTFSAVILGIRDTSLILMIVNELSFRKSIYALSIAAAGIGGIFGNVIAHQFSLKNSYWGLICIYLIFAFILLGLSISQNVLSLLGCVLGLGLTEAMYYYLRSNIFFKIIPDHSIAQGAAFFKIFNTSARSMGVFCLGFFLPQLLPSEHFLTVSIFSFFALILSFVFKPHV